MAIIFESESYGTRQLCLYPFPGPVVYNGVAGNRESIVPKFLNHGEMMRLSSPGAHSSISVVTPSSPGALPMFIWFKAFWSSGKGGAAVIQEDMCAVWAVFLHTLLATGIAPLWISRKCCRQDWASPNGFCRQNATPAHRSSQWSHPATKLGGSSSKQTLD